MMTTTTDPIDIVKEKYAWPGGYELFAITDDGGVLCFQDVITEEQTIKDSYPGDGWHVVGYDHIGNTDEEVVCDHCCRTIGERTKA